MALPIYAGYVLAIGSALLNGSWPAIVKSPRVVEAQLAPLLLNFFFVCGFGVVGLGVIAATRELRWTSWGLLSGAMLTGASCLTLGVASSGRRPAIYPSAHPPCRGDEPNVHSSL